MFLGEAVRYACEWCLVFLAGGLHACASNRTPINLFSVRSKCYTGLGRVTVFCVAFLTMALTSHNRLFPPDTLPGVRWTSVARSVLHPRWLFTKHRRPGIRSLVVPRDAECCVGMGVRSSHPQSKRFTLSTNDCRARVDPPLKKGRAHACRCRSRSATWLILPVVICLSQRLSHACVSMNEFRL